MNPIRKIETDNGVELWCPQCEEYLPEDDFYINVKSKHGRASHCIECIKKRERLKREERVGTPMSDKEIVNGWLIRMGYDVNGDKSVHEQFMERHADSLAPKPKPTPTPKVKPTVRRKADWTEEEWYLYRKRRNMEYLKKLEEKKK